MAFGYPLVNGISHLADNLPVYVSNAQHGQGWIGQLVTKYHLQTWVEKNAPKLASYGRDLAQPALSLGAGSRLAAVFAADDLCAGRADAAGGAEDANRGARADGSRPGRPV